MKHTIKAFYFTVFILCFLLFSCEKSTSFQADENEFLKENKTYAAEIQKGERNEKVNFYQSDDKIFLSHTDPNSPLFELEEIVSDDLYLAKFQGIEYESKVSRGNADLIYRITEVLDDEEPRDTKKEKESIFLTYAADSLTFVLKMDQNKDYPQEISGEFQGNCFKIIFLN